MILGHDDPEAPWVIRSGGAYVVISPQRGEERRREAAFWRVSLVCFVLLFALSVGVCWRAVARAQAQPPVIESGCER